MLSQVPALSPLRLSHCLARDIGLQFCHRMADPAEGEETEIDAVEVDKAVVVAAEGEIEDEYCSLALPLIA